MIILLGSLALAGVYFAYDKVNKLKERKKKVENKNEESDKPSNDTNSECKDKAYCDIIKPSLKNIDKIVRPCMPDYDFNDELSCAWKEYIYSKKEKAITMSSGGDEQHYKVKDELYKNSLLKLGKLFERVVGKENACIMLDRLKECDEIIFESACKSYHLFRKTPECSGKINELETIIKAKYISLKNKTKDFAHSFKELYPDANKKTNASYSLHKTLEEILLDIDWSIKRLIEYHGVTFKDSRVLNYLKDEKKREAITKDSISRNIIKNEELLEINIKSSAELMSKFFACF